MSEEGYPVSIRTVKLEDIEDEDIPCCPGCGLGTLRMDKTMTRFVCVNLDCRVETFHPYEEDD